MRDTKVVQFVLENVRTDARVRKSGRKLHNAGFDVTYVGFHKKPNPKKPRFYRGEDLDECPCYFVNDGRRIYEPIIDFLNQQNPIRKQDEKIKSSILRALSEPNNSLKDRFQTLALSPAYALCLLGREIRMDAYLDQFWGFQNRAARVAQDILSLGPDVVHAHDLDAYALIAPFGHSGNVKLIYDSHELETGRNAPRWTKEKHAAHAALEEISIPLADRVIAVGPAICEILSNQYQIPLPTMVPNSPPKKNIRTNQRLAKRLGLGHNERVILYLGGIMPNRGIEELIQSLDHLPEHIHIAFIGYPVSIYKPKFQALLDEYSVYTHRIHVLGRKPYEDVIFESYGADLGFNAINLTCESYKNALPNKFFEYVFANIPVLSTKQKDVATLTQEYGLGGIIEDTSPRKLAQAIEMTLETFPEGISHGPRQRFINEYCWENQSKKLLEIYTQL